VIVLITGDRNWDDWEAVEAFAKTLNPLQDIVVQGEARGADTMVFEVACRRHSVATLCVPPHWNYYGLGAGGKRNARMAEIIGKPDACVYFHNDLGASKGTALMVKIAKHQGIPVYSWREWVDTTPAWSYNGAVPQ